MTFFRYTEKGNVFVVGYVVIDVVRHRRIMNSVVYIGIILINFETSAVAVLRRTNNDGSSNEEEQVVVVGFVQNVDTWTNQT